MKKVPFYLLILILIINFSCSRKIKTEERLETKDMLLTEPPPAPKSPEQFKAFDTAADTSLTYMQAKLPGSNPDWDKKIIKTANLKIEVKDIRSFNDVVHKAAKQYGGYVSNEEQNQSNEKIESIISIKVPVEQFESLLNQLPSDVNKIIEKRITTNDVTGEVVDTKSRLQAKEQMRLKYLEFLKQSKNMEDVLKVQSEINTIQEEIESASGRINYLSHQSAYSTINITFFQPLPGYIPNDKIPGFLSRTLDAFKTGFNFITEIFIGFVSIWPIFLVAFIAWFLYKKRNVSLTSSKQIIR